MIKSMIKLQKTTFTGFAEITRDEFLQFPLLATNADSTAQFLNDKNGLVPRLDKFFFQNQVNYNEQPFGELIRAEFFELDFSQSKWDHSVHLAHCAKNSYWILL